MKTVTLVECCYPNVGMYDLFYRNNPIEPDQGPFTMNRALTRAQRYGYTHYKIDPVSMLPRCTRTPIPKFVQGELMKSFLWMLFLFIMAGSAPENSHWQWLWATLLFISVALSASKPDPKRLRAIEEEQEEKQAHKDIPDDWKV